MNSSPTSNPNNNHPPLRTATGKNPTVTRCSDVLDNLKILSWNIHDSSNGKEGRKIDDDDFMNVLTSCPIFCLQETKGKVFIPDYKCFNSVRPGSRSGGLCIGIHRSIAGNVKLLKTGSTDIQSVSIKFDFDPDKDIEELIVINVYDSPEHSSFKMKRRQDAGQGDTISTLDALLEFTMNDLNNGNNGDFIYLAGDFNARTASSNFIFEDGDLDSEIDRLDLKSLSSHHYEMNRSSKDTVTNARGKLFLDYLACANLTMLNGCVLGDIMGEFTSVNYNGSSVVDYVATSQDLRGLVKAFKVLNLTKHSDHKPCETTLTIRHHFTAADDILESLQEAPVKYKWPNDDTIDTKFMISMNSPSIKANIVSLTNTHCSSDEEVLQLNSDIVQLYRDARFYFARYEK